MGQEAPHHRRVPRRGEVPPREVDRAPTARIPREGPAALRRGRRLDPLPAPRQHHRGRPPARLDCDLAGAWDRPERYMPEAILAFESPEKRGRFHVRLPPPGGGRRRCWWIGLARRFRAPGACRRRRRRAADDGPSGTNGPASWNTPARMVRVASTPAAPSRASIAGSITRCCPASPSRREPAAPGERPRPSRVRDVDEVSAVGGDARSEPHRQVQSAAELVAAAARRVAHPALHRVPPVVPGMDPVQTQAQPPSNRRYAALEIETGRRQGTSPVYGKPSGRMG